MGYRNAGEPEPPYRKLCDLPNGAVFRTVHEGYRGVKVGWHKDRESTGAVRVSYDDGENVMCASAHVVPE